VWSRYRRQDWGVNKGIAGQAHRRLQAADKKAKALAHSRSDDEIIDLWSEFLTEQHRFFNRLGNAMETRSEQGRWERIIAARKADPLLSYLLHARNADEHGRNSITAARQGSIGLAAPGEALLIDELVIESGRVTVAKMRNIGPQKGPGIHFEPAKVVATSVEDRGRTYHPPSDQPVANLARQAVTMLGQIYDTATS
jgi:hypothetical protein